MAVLAFQLSTKDAPTRPKGVPLSLSRALSVCELARFLWRIEAHATWLAGFGRLHIVNL